MRVLKEVNVGTIVAVCASEHKGTRKSQLSVAVLRENYGMENDAHAGFGPRQVSLLSLEKIEAFKKRGALVSYGDFGENLVVSGIDLVDLPLGTCLTIGEILLELSQIGKECHTRCAIYHRMGECIMPTQGVFAKVPRGGTLSVGDTIELCQ